jgi:hypothetical protein
MNTIADIDDAKLGRMMKALLVRTELEGGNLSIQRTQRKPFGVPGGDAEAKELPQLWTVQANTYNGTNPYASYQTALSHADLGELLERVAVANR